VVNKVKKLMGGKKEKDEIDAGEKKSSLYDRPERRGGIPVWRIQAAVQKKRTKHASYVQSKRSRKSHLH